MAGGVRNALKKKGQSGRLDVPRPLHARPGRLSVTGCPWHHACPMTAEQLIKSLELAPHPEGGFFRETHRAGGMIGADALPAGFTGARAFSTSIYYLLAAEQVSTFHRIKSDESWHFHLGDALEVIDIAPDGTLTTSRPWSS